MGFRILVVDDSSLVRNFHSNILQSAGFEADTAIDGMDALEKAMQRNYSLIVTDINMPRMDGITFIEELRKLKNEVPVIVLTTQSEPENRKKALQAGANLYIVKPVKPEQLILNIKMLLGIV